MARILLVDDSPVDRQLFTELLRKETDFDVSSCEDGEAALKEMATDLPDIVLTDMQMPVMDGLELVKHGREKFPNVPFIIITGYGSEDLATQALRAGAAGYVPKSNSAEMMAATIRHVLELRKTSVVDPRVNVATSLIQYELRLENDETLIPGLLQLIHQRLPECITCDAVTLLQIETAVEQAVLNAIYHGNLEFKQYADIEFDENSRRREAKTLCAKPPYADRRVTVLMRFMPNEARFVIKDEGDGFDVREVSSLGFTHSLRGELGRGLFLMWTFMDKVVFDKTGSHVTLIKRFAKETPNFEEVLPPAQVVATKTEGAVEEAPNQEPKLVLRGAGGTATFEVIKNRLTIGRDASCDIVIDSAAISSHHCLLYLHEGWWFIRNLRSKNGFRINGAKYESHLLPPDANLSLGPHEFHVEYFPHKLGGIGLTPPVSPF